MKWSLIIFLNVSELEDENKDKGDTEQKNQEAQPPAEKKKKKNEPKKTKNQPQKQKRLWLYIKLIKRNLMLTF